MHSIKDVVAEIRDFLEENHLVAYPQALSIDSDSILQVEWEGDDWHAFLELAPVIGAQIVYIGTFELPVNLNVENENEIENGNLDSGENLTYRSLYSSEDDEEALIRIFGKDHAGEASSLRLTYVVGGVAHSWTTFAPWYEEALAKIILLREQGKAADDTIIGRLRNLRERSEDEDWALEVARDRRFFAAEAIPSARQKATLQILAEMTSISSSDPLLVGVSWSTSTSARHLLPQVKQELEDDALSRISEFALELSSQHPEWTSLRISLREKYARAFLVNKIGMNLPVVTAEVARFNR